MRHARCVFVFIIVCNLAAFAQDAPKAEIFAGYSFANYELLPAGPSFSNSEESVSGNPSGRLNTNGWNASAAVKMNSWFSFVTDFSGYYSASSTSTTMTETFNNTCLPVSCAPQTDTITNVASHPRIYNFLFGPQFSYPGDKIRPFVHFLVGGRHVDVAQAEAITSSSGTGISVIAGVPSQGSLEFAMALGGGADYSIKRNLAWRLQADYLTNQGTSQNPRARFHRAGVAVGALAKLLE